MMYSVVLLGERFRREYTETLKASGPEQARKRAIRRLSRQFPGEAEWTTLRIYEVRELDTLTH